MVLSLTSPSSSSHPEITHEDDSAAATLSRPDLDMLNLKERPYLEIHLDNEYVSLKGTGPDVEPARLTGRVALYLAESTPIKEITLHFRGKARLPPASHDSIHTAATFVVCDHDWSFLEGEKRHSHTLKAGCHFFPFQLQVGGSLPSSTYTTAFGGASVAYKLRANVVRPGLNSNLQTVIPVYILRTFTAEALEYQQTLEIENTWPDKLMYSIMIPHKAWATTDTLTALVKFSPLVKGVSVVSVTSAIHETTKLNIRSSAHEYTRVVTSVKHEIVNGKAVEVPLSRRFSGSSTPAAPPATPPNQSSGSYFPVSTPEGSGSEAGSSLSSGSTTDIELTEEQGQTDIVTHISFPIPASATPTHAPAPIVVSHRLRWNILIMNPDGHTSELRCSLPLHLLDKRLLLEARANTAPTRRLLIGGPEVPEEEEEEAQLPSYRAHVRDRVANMYLPEAATVRVTNPWLPGNSNVVLTPPAIHTPSLVTRSGHASPLESHVLSHLPHAPGSGDSTPLDWLNSELLLSLELNSMHPDSSPPAPLSQLPSSHSGSDPTSRSTSRPSSGRPSRRSSRASSPERQHPEAGRPSEVYVHSSNAARSLHGVFTASMKPFTALAHPHWLSPSRSVSYSAVPTLASTAAAASQANQGQSRPLSLPDTSPVLLQRAYSEVPNYGLAARGFIGGVPPLFSMTGLPSYEEAERTQSAPVTPAAR
ncbi:arrestin-C domain-containing protein [Favolaschia claudopus]|uniref:Arrestin-C domain-containing protein n=1 Tax=Favolaschia claudopus TaxID=2862362 RepID=A0AAW0AA40_9AGAR